MIEIDGGYHKQIAEKDAIKDTKWAERGYTTIRITNQEVYEGSYKDRLKLFL